MKFEFKFSSALLNVGHAYLGHYPPLTLPKVKGEKLYSVHI